VQALKLLLELIAVALAWVGVARLAPPPWRARLTFLIKLYLTLRVVWLIALHEVDGVTIYSILAERLVDLSLASFVAFTLLATGLKLVGIAASITRWILMLHGQGIQLPVRHIVGAFFIGRFLGTFLPSTLGLDGYKLYDASRFSGRSIEVTTATAVEKVLGLSGVFGTFLIALPLGVSIFGQYAPVIALFGVPIGLLPLAVVALGFFWPGPVLIRWILNRLPLPTLRRALERIADGASSYADKKGLLLVAWLLSLVQHFTTAAMYYATARALGVQPHAAGFWEVTFASSIQIFATVISPFTIAGEGIREVAQGLLLQNQMTFAIAAASGLLGFLAAEAPTLLGAIPWLTRRESYRPAFCLVDGEQVDYDEARRAAADLGVSRDAGGAAAEVEPLFARLRLGVPLGLGAGALAGVMIGFAESFYLLYRGKIVEEAQVFWAGPLAYALLFGALGAFGGAALSAVPFPRSFRERWIPALGIAACFTPYALIATLFFAYRDAYAEQLPPLGVLLSIAAAHGVVAAALFGGTLAIGASRLRGLIRARVALALAVGGVLAGALGGRVLGPAPPAGSEPRPVPARLANHPNVILVIVDTLRADALDLYDASGVRTPALRRLARDGTLFRAAFAQASWTKPSIASILTGLYPSSHGAVHKPSQLPDSVVTLAEAFQAFGYTTGGIVTNINLAPSFNFQQGFEEYAYLTPDYLFGAEDSSSRLLLYEIARRAAARLSGGVRPGQAYQPAELVNARAYEWLDRHQDERFFLLLHYMEPHDPYFTHPDDGRAIARATLPDPDPELANELRRRYRGEIEHWDAQLGELLDELERRGLYRNALIAVTSDHGEEFQDHGGWWHGLTLYDEQIGVPLVVKWPRERRGAGPVWRGQVETIDLVPTLLGQIGAPIPPNLHGEDLLDPAGTGDGEREVFAEEDHEGNVLQAVREGGWKLIRANPGNPRGLGEIELYDLAADPAERENLAAREAVRARILLDDLEELAVYAASQAREQQDVEIGRAECERLKALGYVEDCGDVE
jgi:arylsulfatase A-like enzyme